MEPTPQIALLVDGDNVRGQSWGTLLERAREHGRLAVARLYMDFQSLRDGGMAARAAGFEPMHVLGKRAQSGFKSMVDVALATDGMSILYDNPQITTLIVGSGDADFMPLLRHWKRHGKHTIVMSGADHLATELRQVADVVVTIGGDRTRRPKAPLLPTTALTSLDRSGLRDLILRCASRTRLTDRETSLPLVRGDWLIEELHARHPETASQIGHVDALLEIIRADIPQLEPIDARARTFLLGKNSTALEASTTLPDEELFDLFGELCREVLPTDNAWMAASIVLNEAKRLLEEGAGYELPTTRPTGWFRALLKRTEGVVVRDTRGGHMEVQRGTAAE